jgi:hypothetical protein
MGRHCSKRAGPVKPFQLFEDFSNNQTNSILKIQNEYLPDAQKHPNMA